MNGETIVLFKSLDELNDDREDMVAKYRARVAAVDREIEALQASSLTLIKNVKTGQQLQKAHAEFKEKCAAIRDKQAAIDADFTAENGALRRLEKRSRRFIQQLGSN
jgi:hypothetical protein